MTYGPRVNVLYGRPTIRPGLWATTVPSPGSAASDEDPRRGLDGTRGDRHGLDQS